MRTEDEALEPVPVADRLEGRLGDRAVMEAELDDRSRFRELAQCNCILVAMPRLQLDGVECTPLCDRACAANRVAAERAPSPWIGQ